MSDRKGKPTTQGKILTATGELHDSTPRSRLVVRYLRKHIRVVIAVVTVTGTFTASLIKISDFKRRLFVGSGAEQNSSAQVSDDDSLREIDGDSPRVLQAKPWLGETEIILISGGSFHMGSPDGEAGREGDENLHKVNLTYDFWITSTEITQEHWRSIVHSTRPSFFRECGSECPVERVNWFEAITFANLLSEEQGLESCYDLIDCKGNLGEGCVNGKASCEGGYICEDSSRTFKGLSCAGYRLPTEAEWEYAARAGIDTAIYNGSLSIPGTCNAPQLDSIAWYCGNSSVEYAGAEPCDEWPSTQYETEYCGTNPVALKKPNSLGLFDMIGNVWEWVQDGVEWDGQILDNSYRGVQEDPLSPYGSHRVWRGGAWDDAGAKHCRSASRHADHPDHRHFNLGFRLARTVTSADAN